MELQGVLDACLFEPGVWQESKVRKMPSCIPCKNRRENLSTPSGLLFNELVKSPRTILSCLEEMLNLIMEMDSGRYSRKSCSVILYVLRLVIRVEGYMMYVIQNDEWRRSDRKDSSGTGASSSVRGLECTEANVSLIRSSAERIRRCIDGYAFPMLERWARHLLDSDNMLDSCTVRIWSLEFEFGVRECLMYHSLTHSPISLEHKTFFQHSTGTRTSVLSSQKHSSSRSSQGRVKSQRFGSVLFAVLTNLFGQSISI